MMLRQKAQQPRALNHTTSLSSVCRSWRPAGRQAALVPYTSPAQYISHLATQTLAPTSRQRCSHIAKITPFDQAWGTQIDGQSLASQLFAFSLFPYLAFLFYLTRSGQAPRLMLFGFYFLLVFVGATIPAGIYAKTHYGTSLANVDWLHGSAESLLTVTNLFIVLGLRQAIRQAEAKNAAEAAAAAETDVQAAAAAAAASSNGNGSSNGAPAAVEAAEATGQSDRSAQ